MTRYSTCLALSNLKNSLKPFGSWVVSIIDLAHQLDGLEALLRGPFKPIGFLVGPFAQSPC